MNSYLFFYLEFIHECCFKSGKGGHFDGERRNIDLNSWNEIRDGCIHCKTSGQSFILQEFCIMVDP